MTNIDVHLIPDSDQYLFVPTRKNIVLEGILESELQQHIEAATFDFEQARGTLQSTSVEDGDAMPLILVVQGGYDGKTPVNNIAYDDFVAVLCSDPESVEGLREEFYVEPRDEKDRYEKITIANARMAITPVDQYNPDITAKREEYNETATTYQMYKGRFLEADGKQIPSPVARMVEDYTDLPDDASFEDKWKDVSERFPDLVPDDDKMHSMAIAQNDIAAVKYMELDVAMEKIQRNHGLTANESVLHIQLRVDGS